MNIFKIHFKIFYLFGENSYNCHFQQDARQDFETIPQILLPFLFQMCNNELVSPYFTFHYTVFFAFNLLKPWMMKLLQY